MSSVSSSQVRTSARRHRAGLMWLPGWRVSVATGPWSTTLPADFIALVSVAVLIRLLLVPQPGNTSDLAGLVRFGSQVALQGPHKLYDPPDLHDFSYNFNYPPLIPYLLAVTFRLWGLLSLLLGVPNLLRSAAQEGLGSLADASFAPSLSTGAVLVKLWGIAGDVALGAGIYGWVKRHGDAQSARVAAAAYLFSPGVVYVSAWWGQLESLFTLCVVMAVASVADRRVPKAWLWLTAGVLMKPQTVVVVPIVALATALRGGLAALAQGVGIALAFALVCTSPFWATGRLSQIVAVYRHAADAYPRVSVNAFNAWWAFGGSGGGVAVWLPDTAVLFAGMSYRAWGLIALAGYTALVLRYLLSRNRSRRNTSAVDERALGPEVFMAAASLYLAFFMLPTQIHERYLFPVIPLLCMLLYQNKAVVPIYALLSLTYAGNLVHIVPWDPEVVAILNTLGLTSRRLALANVAALIAMTVLLLRGAFALSTDARSASHGHLRTYRSAGLARCASFALSASIAAYSIGLQLGPGAPFHYRPLPADPVLLGLGILVLVMATGFPNKRL